MSRLVVKNLPNTVTAKTLEELFSEKGTITDLQLKYNNKGKFRNFGFVGYKTEKEAREALEYFNNTFINTNKIQVELCKHLNDRVKSWKEKISESKAASREFKNAQKDEKKSSKVKKGKDDIPEELKDDEKFMEFLEVHKDRKQRPLWAEDINGVAEGHLEEDSSSDSEYDDNYETQAKADTSNDTSTSATTKESEKQPVKSATTSSKNKAYDDSFTVKIKNLPSGCKKKNIKKFFEHLKISSVRLPPKYKTVAYVKFKTEKDMKQALNKHRGFLDESRVDVIQYTRKLDEQNFMNGSQNPDDKEKNMDLLAETGRIYIRNLHFNVKEEEIEQLFVKYGPLAEVHLPIDMVTKKCVGYAFVSYVFAEHAVKAFAELDGTIFAGRNLHLIPAEHKKQYEIDETESTNYKKTKLAKLKQLSGSSHNWNILFLDKNAVADVIAEKYKASKSELLSGDSRDNLAVRMALAETEMVMETRKFLVDNGVQLDAFSQAACERSKTVIIIKHLPAKTKAAELEELFSKFGTVARVIMPPSGIVALVEFSEPTEARAAFRKLAYSKFHSLPLYLEWAPVDGVKPAPAASTTETETNNDDEESKEKEGEAKDSADTSQDDVEEPPSGSTIFVKNLNFDTTREAFEKHFKKCGPIHYASISTKKDTTGKLLSMGFGFVQFKDKESAVKALQDLQRSQLDGHSLELKFAKREMKAASLTQKRKYEVKKQQSTKFLVRNIPFHASEKEIHQLFKEFGMLKSVRLPKKLDGSGGHRGFGFVEYQSKDNAKRAFNALCHSTHFFGRRLVLEWANPESEDVEQIRQKVARNYVDEGSKKKVTKKTLSEDVALASARRTVYDDEDD